MASKVFLFGLDNSGKTSIVNAINKVPNPGETSPTLSFSINKIVIENTEFVIWDAPGQVHYRAGWGKGLMETRILCFVLDVLAPQRFDEAKKELLSILNDDSTRGIPLVICFHKLDIPDYKKHLPEAKGKFAASMFADHKVYPIETTIFNPGSIVKLKGLFIELIQQARW